MLNIRVERPLEVCSFTTAGDVPDTCMTRSIKNNTDFAPVASGLDCILRSANFSFRTVFVNPNMSRDVDNQVETPKQTSESNIEGYSTWLAREPAHPAAHLLKVS